MIYGVLIDFALQLGGERGNESVKISAVYQLFKESIYSPPEICTASPYVAL